MKIYQIIAIFALASILLQCVSCKPRTFKAARSGTTVSTRVSHKTRTKVVVKPKTEVVVKPTTKVIVKAKTGVVTKARTGVVNSTDHGNQTLHNNANSTALGNHTLHDNNANSTNHGSPTLHSNNVNSTSLGNHTLLAANSSYPLNATKPLLPDPALAGVSPIDLAERTLQFFKEYVLKHNLKTGVIVADNSTNLEHTLQYLGEDAFKQALFHSPLGSRILGPALVSENSIEKETPHSLALKNSIEIDVVSEDCNFGKEPTRLRPDGTLTFEPCLAEPLIRKTASKRGPQYLFIPGSSDSIKF